MRMLVVGSNRLVPWAIALALFAAATLWLAEPRVATVRDIADTVLFLASDESRVITAAQIPVDMGATKV